MLPLNTSRKFSCTIGFHTQWHRKASLITFEAFIFRKGVLLRQFNAYLSFPTVLATASSRRFDIRNTNKRLKSRKMRFRGNLM